MASRVAHRAPLPHIGPSDPSLFQKWNVKWTSGPSAGARRMTPSAPMPSRRSHNAAMRSAVKSSRRRYRPSNIRKSFPEPVILWNTLPVFTRAP